MVYWWGCRGAVRIRGFCNGWGWWGGRLALVRALVSANLNGALEVDLHGVRELEGLEVGVGEHAGAGPEVLDLAELGHELGAGHTALLVH